MKITRRSAIIAGTIATVAVAGALIAGPASAFGRSGSASGGTSTFQSFGMMGGRGGDMMGGFDADGDGRPDSSTAGGPMMRGRGFGPMLGRGGMLHSEGVIARLDATGKATYVTVRMQQGKVTSATDATIVVTSDDGYVGTWPITSTTKLYRNGAVVKGSAFAVGDIVMAAGTVAGGTVTTNIVNDFAGHRFLVPSTGTASSSSASTNA
jgi:hypothetical protein